MSFKWHYNFGTDRGCGTSPAIYSVDPGRVTCKKCLRKLRERFIDDLAAVAGNLADPPMEAGDVVSIRIEIERKK